MPQPVLHQSRALCSEGIVHISAAASAITMPCTKCIPEALVNAKASLANLVNCYLQLYFKQATGPISLY